LNVLFKHAQKRESENIKLLAVLHGAKPKKQPLAVTSSQIDYNGDPDSLEHMSQEKKEALTEQMMAEHKKMFEKTGLTDNG